MATDTSNLANEGFRFIERNAVFAWVHPALVPQYLKNGGTDTTDMDDDEFAQYVAKVTKPQQVAA